MTDEELSLAVARIMYSKYKWEPWGGVAISDHDGMEFLYTDKDCAWDMVVWLATNSPVEDLDFMLACRNPHKEIALAILEVNK